MTMAPYSRHILTRAGAVLVHRITNTGTRSSEAWWATAMEKLLSEATITPFLCCSWKQGCYCTLVSHSCPIWPRIILMVWLPFFPLLADWIVILWYTVCMAGVISGFTHKAKTAQDQPLCLHYSGFNSCSIGKSWKTPTDHRRADSRSLRAYISALPVWNYFISASF